MKSLNPNKTSMFNGLRDKYSVRSCLYQFKRCIVLFQAVTSFSLDYTTKVTFAAKFISGALATWSFIRIYTNNVPQLRKSSKTPVYQDLVSLDSVICSRDKLERLAQRMV